MKESAFMGPQQIGTRDEKWDESLMFFCRDLLPTCKETTSELGFFKSVFRFKCWHLIALPDIKSPMQAFALGVFFGFWLCCSVRVLWKSSLQLLFPSPSSDSLGFDLLSHIAGGHWCFSGVVLAFPLGGLGSNPSQCSAFRSFTLNSLSSVQAI